MAACKNKTDINTVVNTLVNKAKLVINQTNHNERDEI